MYYIEVDREPEVCQFRGKKMVLLEFYGINFGTT